MRPPPPITNGKAKALAATVEDEGANTRESREEDDYAQGELVNFTQEP